VIGLRSSETFRSSGAVSLDRRRNYKHSAPPELRPILLWHRSIDQLKGPLPLTCRLIYASTAHLKQSKLSSS